MKISLTSLMLLLLFILGSCKKSQTSEQPKETFDPSIIKGIVLLYDQGTNSSNRSEMTVTLENSNPLVSTVTDSIGKFSIKVDTTLHSFTLVYTKPLYGTYKEFYTRSNDSLYVYEGNFSDNQTKTFLGEGQGVSPNLGQKSTVIVNSLQASIVNSKITLTCNVTGTGYIQLFYQKNIPITSFAAIPKSTKNTTGVFFVNNGNNVLDTNANSFFSSPTIGNAHSGDIIYITAYGNAYFTGAYFDRTINQMVLPNINLSNSITPISFIMP